MPHIVLPFLFMVVVQSLRPTQNPISADVQHCGVGELPARVSIDAPLCPGGVFNVLHIVMPAWNSSRAILSAAVSSIQKQRYPRDRFQLWLVMDGGSNLDASATLAEVCGGKIYAHACNDVDIIENECKGPGPPMSISYGISCIALPKHVGPAGARFAAFQQVSRYASPNDVLVLVDGDDELSSPAALATINNKYIDEGAWCTYGSYTGLYSENTQPLPDKHINPRDEARNTKKWRYGHPHTFKVFFLEHLGKQDFAMDGTWLRKATDRGYWYRVMELAGNAHVGYIPEVIYEYKVSQASTIYTVPAAVKDESLAYILQLPRSVPLEFPLHIVLVTYKRAQWLDRQLESLWAQNVSRELHVHILNNNIDNREIVDSICRSFQLAKKGHPRMKLTVLHSRLNGWSFSRFVYVSELRTRLPMNDVMFVDDDQLWDEDFAHTFLSQHRPKSSVMWYGKNWFNSERHGPHEVANYWAPSYTPNVWGITKQCAQCNGRWKYGGPGGSLFDANLWLFDEQLLRLKGDLKRYIKYDDIWVSFVMDGVLGWEMRQLATPWQPTHLDHVDTITGDVGIWQQSETKEEKQDMFADLQLIWHWDVWT